MDLNGPSVVDMIKRLEKLYDNKKSGDQKYYMRMRCQNCGSEGVSGFRKGIDAHIERCPKCECASYMPTKN